MNTSMFAPRVSIVIPVYNGHDFLREAVDSALAQTYTNVEVVIVNDGSSDDGATERVALAYGNKVRYFTKPNGGVASALNRAIEEMTGEYFSWLSHDDLYTMDKVEKEVQALSRCGRPETVIYSDYSVFTNDPDSDIPVRMKGVPPEHFRYWITVENALHGCTLLIPRSAFTRVGRFDESLRTTQDYDLWFRLAKEIPFVHLPEVLVKARSHADQGSHKMADVASAECNALLSNFIRGLSQQEILSATGKPLVDSYADIAASMFRRGFDAAGALAEEYTKSAGLSRSCNTGGIARTMKRSGYKIANFGRMVLPVGVKHMLKKALYRAGKDDAAGAVAGIEPQRHELKAKFSEVYEKNIFGGRESRSGEGSDLVQTEVIRRELPRIVEKFSIQTFLDAPCGDWYWMRHTNLGVKEYIGVDIVEAMIQKHQVQFRGQGRTFMSLNLAAEPLPKADLIFSRDCLVHLSFADALKIIANFKKSGAKYLLTTTFVDRTQNNDLVGADSFWRPLNMCLAPFNFPTPLLLINEGCTEESSQFTDKSLGLWALDEIAV